MAVVLTGGAADLTWQEVGGGVSLHMRGADVIEADLARQRAGKAMRAIGEGADALAPYGLTGVTPGMLAEGGVNLSVGLGACLFAVELALIVADDWRGVMVRGPKGGERKAPYDREHVTHLFRRLYCGRSYGDRFLGLALAGVEAEAREKKS